MAVDSSIQRIARLTPLADILQVVEARVRAVAPRRCALAEAGGCVLAEDVLCSRQPEHPIALRDGYAVEAAALADASAYAPLPFAALPQRVDAGQSLPGGTDAVLPVDAVVWRDEQQVDAIASAAPGDGVLAAGADGAGGVLRRAGERLRTVDLAVMTAFGIAEATIRRPRVRLALGGTGAPPPLAAARDLLRQALLEAGAAPCDAPGAALSLEAALTQTDAVAVIAVGGTGSGRNDAAVRLLQRLGKVEAHGIAVAPGETAAVGFAHERPVLLLPGRIDAAIAVWLLVGRHLVARLAGGRVDDTAAVVPLKRKVTSTIGLAELIPVACAGGVAEPLAAGYLSWQALAASDGWIVVPADSEGYAAGTPVAVRAWR